MRNRAAVAALALLLPGCALVRQGTSQTVTFRSNPPGAEVWVNGKKHKEVTPTTVNFPKKEQSVVFKLKGFEDEPYRLKCRTSSFFYWSLVFGILAGGIDYVTGAWKEFEIPDDGIVNVQLAPDKENPEQFVQISSNPSGASIRIGNLDQGNVVTGIRGKGSTVKVIWGKSEREKTVILKLEGYEVAQLALKRGDKTLHKDLEAKPDKVVFDFKSEPPGANVLVDGGQLTTTPSSMELQWYRHTVEWKIEFRLAGYHPWKTTVKSKNETKIVARLEEIVARAPLKIDCAPAGSRIEVDGAFVAAGPAEIELNWSVNLRRHKLTISRPGYETDERFIDEAQRSTPVTVRLRPSLPRLP